MKPGKTREELEEKLIEPVLGIKRRRKVIQNIKEDLLEKHKIIGGNVQSLINNPKKELPNVDWRVLCLFAEQVYLATNDEELNPKAYYTEIELKTAKQYTGKISVKGDISLPLTFEDAIMIDYNQFVAKVSVKVLAQMSALLLNYNFDIQREAKKKVVDGETIQVATLVMDNVMEMKEHLKKGTLETTNIVINASVGSSDTGEEIRFDPETRLLTITEGTMLDIVDGFHRCKASEFAINDDPNIDFNFIVLFLNYTDEQAAKYQGQLAKATPIAKARQRQLAESRYADTIVKQLNTQSELEGRISTLGSPSLINGELVSYNLLSNTINEEFEIKRVYEVTKIGKYLVKFFNILLGYKDDEFIENPLETAKSSLLVENNMFVGYIVLAKRMYKNSIEAEKVMDFIDKIDFSRDNEMWKEIGVLDDKGRFTKTEKVRESIKKFFYSIDVK